MDYKELKKLADTCRKAGIKYFKNAEMEFTLSDEGPISNYKRKQAKPAAEESVVADTLKDTQLTEDQLLFYSVIDATKETVEQ